MLRDWDMSEVSDGKLYTANDMAKLGCQDCSGCSECCRVVGDSIVLDPYDIYQLSGHLGQSFTELLASKLSLRVVDGIVLPNLNIADDGSGCGFLDEAGRCSIHSARPGICRLFPLGRIFEDGSFSYFLQVNECKKPNCTKVKISKWLGVPALAKYERFVNDWHWYLKRLSEEAAACTDDERRKQISMSVLQSFYVVPYNTGEDFYEQFYERMGQAE